MADCASHNATMFAFLALSFVLGLSAVVTGTSFAARQLLPSGRS